MNLGTFRAGIRVDTDETYRGVHGLLRAHLADAGDQLRNNFSLRTPAGGQAGQPGELYVAGCLAARSERMEDLAAALVGHLAGIRASSDGLTRLNLRAFTDGSRVVLVDAPRPVLSAPEDFVQLRREGIEELHVWDPLINPSRGVLMVPPTLGGLAWRRARISKPQRRPAELPIVGLVVRPGEDLHTGAWSVWSTAVGRLQDLNDLIGLMLGDGCVVSAEDASAQLTALCDLLGPAPHEDQINES